MRTSGGFSLLIVVGVALDTASQIESHLIARHYDKVDDRLVFAALATRIPELIAKLGLSL